MVVGMAVSVLGWFDGWLLMFGWLLVCWDGCWGGWMDGNTNNDWKKINNDWKKSDFC
jgi:hypothetical protein